MSQAAPDTPIADANQKAAPDRAAPYTDRRTATKRPRRIRPRGDRILVQPLIETERTINGIVIPESAVDTPHQGRVLDVGPGRRGRDGQLVPIDDLAAGAVVVYGKYAGTIIEVDRTEYLLLREDDIVGVIEAPAPAGEA